MRPLIVLLSFFLIISSITAQNYQGINSSREAAFILPYGSRPFTLFIAIDSIRLDGQDSIFYHHKQITAESAENCFSSDETSWMGAAIRVREDGVHVFQNREGDPIYLHSQASLGDKWEAYRSSATMAYIEAEVTDHDTMSFLGITDSVKTISFQFYDQNGDSIHEDLSQSRIGEYEFKMSKNHGFVQVHNLYYCGDFETHDYLGPVYEGFKIAGLSHPEVGMSNIQWFEVHDYNVGDELHILEAEECYSGSMYYEVSRRKHIYTIIDRVDFVDSIQYVILDEGNIYGESHEGNGERYFLDTIHKTYFQNEEFNLYPGQAVYELQGMSNFFGNSSTTIYQISGNSKFFDDNHHWGWDPFNECFGYAWEPYNNQIDGPRTVRYRKGLGGPYYSQDRIHCFEGSKKRRLVYYKKGEIEWGNPYTHEDLFVSAEPNLDPRHKFDLFPNPASQTVTLDFSQIGISLASIQFIDTHGKICLSTMTEASRTEIDISSLHPGLFFVEMRSEGRVIGMEKLVVH